MEKAMTSLEKETDIINMIRNLRVVKEALKIQMGSKLLGQLKKKCYHVNMEEEEEKEQEAIDSEQKYKAID